MRKKIIVLISIIVVLVISVILFILLNNGDQNKSKDLSNLWSEKYFEALDSFKDLEDQKGNATVYDVNFYDIGDKYPIMVLTAEDDFSKVSTIYYIDSKNKVKQLTVLASSIELLYHIESGKYDYYYNDNVTGNEADIYRKVSDAIEKDGIDSLTMDGIVTNEDGSGNITVDGKEQVINKFSDIFIRVDDNNKGFSYVVGEDAKKLKEKVKKSEKEYKTFSEVVNKEVEEKIKNKLEEKNNKTDENTVADNTPSNVEDNSNNNQQTTNQVDFSGTYYLALSDGSLATDGSGTIIINSDGSCNYYSGMSDLRCKSYTTNDHVICLKTEESGDICFNLTVDNKTLIAPNNEKYLRE